jgi:hypothetical protein
MNALGYAYKTYEILSDNDVLIKWVFQLTIRYYPVQAWSRKCQGSAQVYIIFIGRYYQLSCMKHNFSWDSKEAWWISTSAWLMAVKDGNVKALLKYTHILFGHLVASLAH